MSLRPFFSFYGAKHRTAPRYPAPANEWIVEPFAGSAAYACAFPSRRVLLVDRDPLIAGLWQYLIQASEREILALPDLADGQAVADLGVSPEASTLIGFWLNRGAAGPRTKPSAWMRSGIRPGSFWGSRARAHIASQLRHIRHWLAVCDTYANVPNRKATWFVDPPYVKAGSHYRCSSRALDFAALGQWCTQRHGQTIVCEAAGADWLPFRPFADVKANESKHGGKVSREVIWTNDAQQVAA